MEFIQTQLVIYRKPQQPATMFPTGWCCPITADLQGPLRVSTITKTYKNQQGLWIIRAENNTLPTTHTVHTTDSCVHDMLVI